jgi:hypothetical protein
VPIRISAETAVPITVSTYEPALQKLFELFAIGARNGYFGQILSASVRRILSRRITKYP